MAYCPPCYDSVFWCDHVMQASSDTWRQHRSQKPVGLFLSCYTGMKRKRETGSNECDSATYFQRRQLMAPGTHQSPFWRWPVAQYWPHVVSIWKLLLSLSTLSLICCFTVLRKVSSDRRRKWLKKRLIHTPLVTAGLTEGEVKPTQFYRFPEPYSLNHSHTSFPPPR